MNQRIQPQEQIQPLTVQAMWVQAAISALMAIGMICYFVAEVLKVGSGVFKEAFKKES